MSSLKSHSQVVAGWDLNPGILAPREHSSLFYSVPEIVGSQEMGVVEAGMADGKHRMKTETGVHWSQHPNPASLKTAAPSGPSATGSVAVGTGWPGASVEAGSSLLQLI